MQLLTVLQLQSTENLRERERERESGVWGGVRTVPARFAGPRPDSRREEAAAITRGRGERAGGRGSRRFITIFTNKVFTTG